MFPRSIRAGASEASMVPAGLIGRVSARGAWVLAGIGRSGGAGVGSPGGFVRIHGVAPQRAAAAAPVAGGRESSPWGAPPSAAGIWLSPCQARRASGPWKSDARPSAGDGHSGPVGVNWAPLVRDACSISGEVMCRRHGPTGERGGGVVAQARGGGRDALPKPGQPFGASGPPAVHDGLARVGRRRIPLSRGPWRPQPFTIARIQPVGAEPSFGVTHGACVRLSTSSNAVG